MSRSGSRGQYQPVAILILLLAISGLFTYFLIKPNQKMEAQERNYQAFYTKRVFHTIMKKKVEYESKNHTLLQLVGEGVCPRNWGCNESYIDEFKAEAEEALDSTLPDKYDYSLVINSTWGCGIELSAQNKTYLEKASVVRFNGIGYHDCDYTIQFATWAKE